MKISKMLMGGGIVIALAAALVFSACSNSSSSGGTGPTAANIPTATVALDETKINKWNGDSGDDYGIAVNDGALTITQTTAMGANANVSIPKEDLSDYNTLKLKVANNNTNAAKVKLGVQKSDGSAGAVKSAKVNGETFTADAYGIVLDLAAKSSSSISRAALGSSAEVELVYDTTKAEVIAIGLNSATGATETTGNITLSEITVEKADTEKQEKFVATWVVFKGTEGEQKFTFTEGGDFTAAGTESASGTYTFNGKDLVIKLAPPEEGTLKGAVAFDGDNKMQVTWNAESLAALNNFYDVEGTPYELKNPVKFEKEGAGSDSKKVPLDLSKLSKGWGTATYNEATKTGTVNGWSTAVKYDLTGDLSEYKSITWVLESKSDGVLKVAIDDTTSTDSTPVQDAAEFDDTTFTATITISKVTTAKQMFVNGCKYDASGTETDTDIQFVVKEIYATKK